MHDQYPNPFLDGNEGTYPAHDAAEASHPPPGVCEKCGRKRKALTNQGTEAFPQWWCGTCSHREARRINTREMWGHGKRGY